ncbi:hypothetical protein CBR_g28070 [Chara braunii]|uniref:Photosystem I reaction center subunit V, chloroplastic n=1 Tax=Chara braunii TaxID=69332 RepID=A0A388L980_CHABU|nr:hypothetical protein CBR_g28070 [Chara braunii]|eukprot:GBG78846.1 hypothetical protein CBR_g28070 [Chara braunii]
MVAGAAAAMAATSSSVAAATCSLATLSSSRKLRSGRRTLLASRSLSPSSFDDVKRQLAVSSRTTCVNPSIVISGSTAALLFLGRFVFLPFHRASLAKAGLPTQNGQTHFEAGDTRAQENEGFMKTNDPAGFTLVDVLSWGALGHVVAFFILATASNGYDPQF